MLTDKISVLDYGAGNALSVARMIEYVGGVASIIRTPGEVLDAKKIILPGVGSFDFGMKNIVDRKLINPLNQVANIFQIPVLGICLGMQLMCNSSDEGCLDGLGWINAKVTKFHFPSSTLNKIPHMGWNNISVTKDNALISNDPENRFYFVHSYYVTCLDRQDAMATTTYGFNFDSAINRGNIFGVQFHPEKSHKFGMSLIRNFINLKC